MEPEILKALRLSQQPGWTTVRCVDCGQKMAWGEEDDPQYALCEACLVRIAG